MTTTVESEEPVAVSPLDVRGTQSPLLRTSFWLGAFVLLGGIVLGLLYSIGRDSSLPRLQLAYYPAIEKLVQAGEYRQALDQLNIAIELDFLSRIRIYEEISQIAMQNGQLDDHIEACQALIQADAANDVTRLNLSGSLLMRGKVGDHQRAEQISRQLLQQYPDEAAINCNLGAALLGQQQWDQAAGYFERALELEPGLLQAQAGLAKIEEVKATHE